MPDTHIATITTLRPRKPTLGDLVDLLGDLKAQIADLEVEERTIMEKLKTAGKDSVEGRRYRATISAESCRSTIDRKAIESDMGEAWLAKYLKWGKPSCTCTVYAR